MMNAIDTQDTKADNLLASKQARHIVEYDCLRVVVTILVVLGHCVYYRISTDYGGIDYSELIENKSLLLSIMEKLKVLIYLFHMPLFMTLSGALYGMQKEKYFSLGYLMAVKARRLLIPFFTVSLCYSFPLKFVAGYFKESSDILGDLLTGQILMQGNTHLWFLPTLFFIFVVTYLIERRIAGYNIIKLAIFSILSMISPWISIKAVAYILKYLLWFYVGMYFTMIRESFNMRINRRIFILTAMCVALGCFGWKMTSDSTFLCNWIVNALLEKILTCLLCLFTYIIAYYLSRTAIISTKIYRFLLNDSFGIYLYSDSWNYIILAIGIKFFGGYLFCNNVGTLFLASSRFFLTLVISIFVTEILRKCESRKFAILRYLFL